MSAEEDWEIEKCRRIGVAREAGTVNVCPELEGWSTSEDKNIVDPSSLSPSLDGLRGHKAPVTIRNQFKCDKK